LTETERAAGGSARGAAPAPRLSAAMDAKPNVYVELGPAAAADVPGEHVPHPEIPERGDRAGHGEDDAEDFEDPHL
jgi:hypothetical protein